MPLYQMARGVSGSLLISNSRAVFRSATVRGIAYPSDIIERLFVSSRSMTLDMV